MNERYTIEVVTPIPAENCNYLVKAPIQGEVVASESFDTLESAMECKRFIEQSMTFFL